VLLPANCLCINLSRLPDVENGMREALHAVGLTFANSFDAPPVKQNEFLQRFSDRYIKRSCRYDYQPSVRLAMLLLSSDAKVSTYAVDDLIDCILIISEKLNQLRMQGLVPVPMPTEIEMMAGIIREDASHGQEIVYNSIPPYLKTSGTSVYTKQPISTNTNLGIGFVKFFGDTVTFPTQLAELAMTDGNHNCSRELITEEERYKRWDIITNARIEAGEQIVLG